MIPDMTNQEIEDELDSLWDVVESQGNTIRIALAVLGVVVVLALIIGGTILL